jgi:CHAT domain-containing protein/tetratricopeptide (TPR) repeat protein
MEVRRYYLGGTASTRVTAASHAACAGLTLIALFLGCRLVTAAPAAASGQTEALVDCGPLEGDALPVWPDSAENSKRLVDCGYQFRRDNAYPRARRAFERAIEMAKRRSDRGSLAAALDGFGAVLTTLGEGERAEPALLESERISEELGDTDGVAVASTSMGHLRTMQARYEEARAYHIRSLQLSTAIQDDRGIAVALNNVGSTYRAVGDYITALEYLKRSLAALEKLGDQRRSATVLDNMGTIARRLGDYPQGLELAHRALAIREAFHDQAGIAKSLDSLSEHYQAQGDYGAALEALDRSLELRSAIGLAHATAESLNNIAVVYQAQGNYEQAADYLRKSLALNEAKVGSQSLVAEIQTHLGEVLFLQGANKPAVQILRRSLAISDAAGFHIQAADARYALARVEARLGRLGEAAVSFERCLAFRDETGDRRGRAETLIEMADVDRRRGRLQEGLARAREAQQLADGMELPEVQWRARTAVGRLTGAMGHTREATTAFEDAIALVEDLRAQVGGEETRSRFFSDRLAPYQERIALALRAGRVAEAFVFAERSKARALLDVIRGDRTPLGSTMTDAERRKEGALRTSLASANTEVRLAAQAAMPEEARLAASKTKRDAIRIDYADFQSVLYASHPELLARRAGVPVISASEAREVVSGRPSAAIIEFVVGDQRTWAFLIDAAGVRAFQLPASSAEIAREVRNFRGRLAGRDLRADESARRLYDDVLGPLRDGIKGKAEFTIVPDGVLWDLPFQALRSPASRYVIEDAAVSYAPSVTVLRETMRLRRATRAPATLLALGNPTSNPGAVRRERLTRGGLLESLPEAEIEVQRLAEIYGASSRVYVGPEAREDRWKAEAPRYRVVHLAAHGVLDNSSPLYSYLALAPSKDAKEDGLLEAWEIMNMRLQADLVVLSACETARGRVAPGEGVVGLMWALFVAGTPATLVSQWRIESASSTSLMIRFHEEWHAGASKATALQRASLQVLHTKASAHPFYWAGYILVGDGR